jgi:hypothetical protein
VVTRTAISAYASALLGGCSLITDSFLTNEFSGDPYPIEVETSSGAIVLGMRQAETDDRVAVIDLLSPFTITDQDPMIEPSVSYVDLMLLGKAAPGTPPGGPIDLSTAVPRARLEEARVIALHPCDSDGANEDGSCHIGAPNAPRAFQSIIGADVLAGDAVRLRLGNNQIFVLPDIGGDSRDRTLSCDAVFSSPYRGGGTLVFATTELPFGNRRITLQACLGPDPDPDPQLAVDPKPDGSCTRENERKTIADSLRQHGADALFVVSTSIGISILGEAAYQRYVLAHPEAPALDTLPPDAVYLPSGIMNGRRATIDRIALIAPSSSNTLAPCRQLYAHRLLSALGPIDASEFGTCTDDDGLTMSAGQYAFDSPCKDGSAFCAMPAVLGLTQAAGIDVLVVDDTDATLQALRTELRPDQPEVDGILGTNILRGAEIDVDYPHDRLLARCLGGNCSARPQLAEPDDRCQINRCIKGLQDFRNQAPAGQLPDGENLPGCP